MLERIDLAVAQAHGADIVLSVTMGGKFVQYTLTRQAAASMIERLARALATDKSATA